MKNILVPTDFSKGAEQAFDYACKMASRNRANIHLLHVVYPNEAVDNHMYHAFWIDEYLENRRQQLNMLRDRFQQRKGYEDLHIFTEVAIGYPASTADNYAQDINADIIVIGAIGATHLEGSMLGSTTGALIAKTKRPVLAVPSNSNFKNRAKVALATDFEFNLDSRTFHTFEDFLAAQQAKLHVLHVFRKHEEVRDGKLEKKLSSKLNGIKHDFHYIHNSDVSQGVNDYLEAINASALVAVAHEHDFWHNAFNGSISKVLAQRSRIPVMVLHDSAQLSLSRSVFQ